jgi:hypothetical protein
MLGGIINLASYGLGTGGTAGNILFQLEQQGVFSYVLPFLMIFAIIYAILTNVKILGENRGINIILALSVSLMALQMNFVSYFFREIFPRLGVLLSIILVAIILLGMFFNFKESVFVKWTMGILMTVGVIIIVSQSLDVFNWGSRGLFMGNFWYVVQQNLGTIIMVILIVGGLLAVIFGGSEKGNRKAAFSDAVKDMSRPQKFCLFLIYTSLFHFSCSAATQRNKMPCLN